MELFISYFEYNPGNFIKNIAKVFYLSWKISKTFIQYLKNDSNQIIDYQLIKTYHDICNDTILVFS